MNKDKESAITRMARFLGVVERSALQRFQQIEDIITLQFHIPDLDFLRFEIAKCYVTGADHGSIMLCNMLLERYCKLVLIYNESGFKTIEDLATIESKLRPLVRKYNKLNLSETLQACKKKGIIDQEAYDLFSVFKEVFRDSFSHADPSKTLKGQKGAFLMGRFDGSEIGEVTEITLQNVPPFASIAIKLFAEQNSYGYFVSVENLIRSTIRHYINEQFHISIDLITPKTK